MQAQPRPTPTREELDDLAHLVSSALDDGDDMLAWELTRMLEEAAGIARPHESAPPLPVIGRRFARAHRLLLDRATAVESPLQSAEPGALRPELAACWP